MKGQQKDKQSVGGWVGCERAPGSQGRRGRRVGVRLALACVKYPLEMEPPASAEPNIRGPRGRGGRAGARAALARSRLQTATSHTRHGHNKTGVLLIYDKLRTTCTQ